VSNDVVTAPGGPYLAFHSESANELTAPSQEDLMNPQLTIAMAHSRQQDLRRAAEMSGSAAGLSTGSSLTTRLRASLSAVWIKRTGARSADRTTVTA
jgi:hypothetical protein